MNDNNLRINVKFYESFKELEQLCNNFILTDCSESHGVRDYLNQMEMIQTKNARKCKGWESDYQTLKRYNYKRNQLSHNVDVSFYDDYFTNEDIIWIENFKNRILNQTDPLSLVKKVNSLRKFNLENLDDDYVYDFSDKDYSTKYEDYFICDNSIEKSKNNRKNHESKQVVLKIGLILSLILLLGSVAFLIFTLTR